MLGFNFGGRTERLSWEVYVNTKELFKRGRGLWWGFSPCMQVARLIVGCVCIYMSPLSKVQTPVVKKKEFQPAQYVNTA
jgi:hypothetical protein